MANSIPNSKRFPLSLPTLNFKKYAISPVSPNNHPYPSATNQSLFTTPSISPTPHPYLPSHPIQNIYSQLHSYRSRQREVSLRVYKGLTLVNFPLNNLLSPLKPWLKLEWFIVVPPDFLIKNILPPPFSQFSRGPTT